jgi:hypothetical protein
MRKLVCLLLVLSLGQISLAQGSWNIGYLPVDSISRLHLGRMVKIDFRSFVYYEHVDKRPVRSYVGTRDTGSLSIDTTLLRFAEIRKIYVDNGNYDDQYLLCLTPRYAGLRIDEAEILEVTQQTIVFRMELVNGDIGSAKAEKISKLVQIRKVDLDGVMYKK